MLLNAHPFCWLNLSAAVSREQFPYFVVVFHVLCHRPFETIPDSFPGPEQTGFDRSFPNPQRTDHLRTGQLLHIAQHQHLAELNGQRLNASVQSFPQFCFFQKMQGRRSVGWRIGQQLAVTSVQGSIQRIGFSMPSDLDLPTAIAGKIDDNGRQPGGKRRLATEGVNFAPGSDKTVLDDLAGAELLFKKFGFGYWIK